LPIRRTRGTWQEAKTGCIIIDSKARPCGLPVPRSTRDLRRD